MIVGPYVKAALAAALDDPDDTTHGFHFTTSDDSWEPKLFLFLDSSLIESSTQFDFDPDLADYCGNEVREIPETSRFSLYACSIAEDDGPTAYDIEIEVSKFVALVLKTVAADITLGVDIPGVRNIRTSVTSNETSTKQMSTGGGQLFNACRAVLEIEVSAHIKPAALVTT